jgi:hypothetical protein
MAGLVPAIHVFGCESPGRNLRIVQMNALDEFRRELTESLTSLIDSIASAEIGQNDRNLLAEFVENSEFGVALDWLQSLLVERNIKLSAQQDEEIRKLAQRMDIDLS